MRILLAHHRLKLSSLYLSFVVPYSSLDSLYSPLPGLRVTRTQRHRTLFVVRRSSTVKTTVPPEWSQTDRKQTSWKTRETSSPSRILEEAKRSAGPVISCSSRGNVSWYVVLFSADVSWMQEFILVFLGWEDCHIMIHLI
jgi:hypothetical protein